MNDGQYITLTEFARRIGVCRQRASQMGKEGLLGPLVRVGKRVCLSVPELAARGFAVAAQPAERTHNLAKVELIAQQAWRRGALYALCAVKAAHPELLAEEISENA